MKDFREQLYSWIENFRWQDNKAIQIEDILDDDRLKVNMYTDNYIYYLTASPTYLGCTVSARKPRPGEDWTRGNDLADGKFCFETWVNILSDIVSYELVEMPKKYEPATLDEIST